MKWRAGMKRHFEILEGWDGRWYWRLVAGNNRIVAEGGEGYRSRAGARRAVMDLGWMAEMATDVVVVIGKGKGGCAHV